MDYLLYSRGNQILFRSSQMYPSSPSLVLAQDYAKHLCFTEYGQLIYFAYVSKDHTLLLTNTIGTVAMNLTPYLSLDSHPSSSFDFSSLQGLMLTGGSLDLRLTLLLLDADKPALRVLFPLDNCRCLDFLPKSESASLDELVELQTKLNQLQNKVHETDRQLREKDKELHRKEALLASAQAQYQELMKVATAYKAEAIKWHNKLP